MNTPLKLAARLGGVLLATLTLHAGAADLRIYSAGAAQSALNEAAARYEQSTGRHVVIEYAPVGTLLRRLSQGAQQDAIILSAEAMAEAETKGWTVPGSSFALGIVAVGIAVKEGAAMSDISTPDTLRQTLLAARSIVYVAPDKGTSGKHFAEVLQRMGIADQMQAKTILAEGGYAVEPVARGEVELGVQQITEILPVKGAKLAGPLPAPYGKTTVYAAALSANANNPDLAREFFNYLRSASARAIFVAKGFQLP
ncbi:molybdate ABC transporter substrate-binding protein [Undibacterium terreum]|uniref:Molybdate ABC transporter substrate-binding protein n=1 Tax=Undibacterium terreum TaxID=1224302 RepID=A0A916XDG6_9BURK|nr:molybdate ABC transporter substrate-binding protein [Undibacterium terreum]GGC63751.1 molybdate ABC transporter substrate-binding protein [Undibacterium terreum]